MGAAELTEFVSHKLLHRSRLWYGGGINHRIAQSIAECVALEKGYQTLDSSVYRDAGFQPDLVIRKKEKFSKGARRYSGYVTYGVEIKDTHGPEMDYAKVAGFEDILTIDLNRLENQDSIEELIALCRRVIP